MQREQEDDKGGGGGEGGGKQTASTPPRKKTMVTWRRSPSLLPTTTTSSNSNNSGVDMEDLFLYPAAAAAASTSTTTTTTDKSTQDVFLQWVSSSAAAAVPPPPHAVAPSVEDEMDLLEAACLMAEETAQRRMITLPPQSHSAQRVGRYSRLRIVSPPQFARREDEEEDELRVSVVDVDDASSMGRANSSINAQVIQLVLRGMWLQCLVPSEGILHVCYTKSPGPSLSSSPLVVDDENNWLIINPGVLIAPTKIADAISCARRVGLANRYGINTPSREASLGTLKHSLVEHALTAWRFDVGFLHELIPELVSELSNALFAAEVSEDDAAACLRGGVPALSRWLQAFTQQGIDIEFDPSSNSGVERVRLVRVVGTECEIYSPMFGMKGVLDCVCELERVNPDGTGGERFLVPLEIKTGRPVPRWEHRAQTMMYCLMVADRFATEIEHGGLLLMADFSGGGAGDNRQQHQQPPAAEFKMLGVGVRFWEIKELLRYRNAVAGPLPPRELKTECSMCFQRDLCQLVDDPKSDYFSTWRSIMDREEEAQSRGRLFRMPSPAPAPTSSTRSSKSGGGVCNMRLESVEMDVYTFALPDDDDNDDDDGGMDVVSAAAKPQKRRRRRRCDLVCDDLVMLTLQNAHYYVLRGTVRSVGAGKLAVACQTSDTLQWIKLGGLWSAEQHTYGFANPVSSLAAMMLEPSPESHKARIRKLLAEGDANAPQYWDSESNPFIRRAPVCLLEHCLGSTVENMRRDLARFSKNPPPQPWSRHVDLSGLTCDQLRAVSAVLAAKDFTCVVGAPGAGKTFLLSKLVQILSSQLGKSVLIVTYTNAACNHLMSKIATLLPQKNVLRIGRRSVVTRDLHDVLLPAPNCPTSVLQQHLENPRLVVGVTCLGAKNNALLQRKVFDYCILDEASQVTELHVLASWFCAKVLVAVGDTLQLPPLIQTQQNVESCLEVLLKKRNCLHVQLTTQFRMNDDLNFLANQLFYEDKLQCATEQVERQRLASLIAARPTAATAATGWLARAVDPHRSICFCDTDALGLDLEQAVEGEETGTCNNTECLVVARIVHALTVECGVPREEIGIISPYRAQLVALRLALPQPLSQNDSNSGGGQGEGGGGELEIDTVDKYQGREKACIVVSLVRSNTSQQVGKLLADFRRLNVAFSRAKCKLIVVGSRSTLSNLPKLAQFIGIVTERDWAVKVDEV